MKRSYWVFYWPLALMGLATVIASQFQNGVLARYPDAVRQLAIFAFATGTLQLFAAATGFVPQMANILGKGAGPRRVCLRFTLVVCVALTIPPAFLAFAPPGRQVLATVYSMEGQMLDSVVRYLRYLLPVVALVGLRQYYSGLLLQARRSGLVTGLTVLHLGTVLGTLLLGFVRGWPAIETLAFSQVFSAALHTVLAYVLHLRFCREHVNSDQEQLNYWAVLAFFWPVAVTSIMFALSRPILYSFAKRTGDGVAVVAVLRVAFTFAMIFHAAMNQFRHLFVTFGREQFPEMRRFMVRVLAAIMFIIVLILATPISTVIFQDMLGVTNEVLAMVRETLWVLCAIPVIVTLRNYFHSLSLINRRTGSMALAAVARNTAIWVAAWLLYRCRMLTHVTAGAVLVLGFATETIVVSVSAFLAPRPGWRVTTREDPGAEPRNN